MAILNDTTTRLLTLLNVSAAKAGKRKYGLEDEQNTYSMQAPRVKLNKRPRNTSIDAGKDVSDNSNDTGLAGPSITEEGDEKESEDEEENHEQAEDSYETHFGVNTTLLNLSTREAVDRFAWSSTNLALGRLGSFVALHPESITPPSITRRDNILERLRKPFTERQERLPKEKRQLQNEIIQSLSTYRDHFVSRTPQDAQSETREAISLHVLNHITKKRRRVLKTNERITTHSKSNPNAPPLDDIQDQGFTRPSVLILLPFRNSALAWIHALTSHTPAPSFQIEQKARFEAEYGLPPGAIDKLAQAEPGTYPEDHVRTFSGNVDDNFRLGVKMTRKSVKLYAEFYGCDLIIASPLGLRMAIEKEKNADFLSSIEILVVDQTDALTMQNWDHIQFVLSNLNQMPKEAHDTDFSRVKPWYLDGYAAYLRQSIFLSAYETPEMRHVFNKDLKNVAGKLRTERRWAPVAVPEGIDQVFLQFDCANPSVEADKRFDYFVTQVMPIVLKSAVQSVNTVIFIPSSFDFIRVHNHFRKLTGITFAILSEYSSNQEISRARQAFFSGKKSFLLVSERFHFFRRYNIRGVRNLVFYGPPDHPQFYTEWLSYPFLDEGVEASDVTCKVLYTKFDWMRLERIMGTEGCIDVIAKQAL